MHDKEFESLECEKRYVFFLLMFVGGFLGGFIYGIRNFEQRNQNAHGRHWHLFAYPG